MSDFVRVKDTTTSHEFSVPREFAAENKTLTILASKDAVDVNGVPLAPKYNASIDEVAANRKTTTVNVKE